MMVILCTNDDSFVITDTQRKFGVGNLGCYYITIYYNIVDYNEIKYHGQLCATSALYEPLSTKERHCRLVTVHPEVGSTVPCA